MPRNGNGDFSLAPGNPVIPGTVIESEWANNTMNDLAAALTDSIAADGQTTPLANLPMGGFHHTGVSDPTLRNQYATLGMTQDGRNNRIQITGGVDNLTGTLVGASTAYAAGAILSFFAPANNTGTMTLSYNGIAAVSIVNSQGLPLQAADVVAGKNYLIQYTGTTFQMLGPVQSQAGSIYTQSAVTGQRRPESGTYPPLVLASGTSINIPAGQGVIIPPGADGANDAAPVSWGAQSITLSYLTTSFTTTIAVSNSGVITQFAGRMPAANLRDYVELGIAVHVNGVATSVITSPAIFGDNGYLNVDTAAVLSNILLSGGEATPVGASLQLAVAGGLISSPGGASSSPNSPNTIQLIGGSPISFRTLAGQGTIGGSLITTAPVTQYDPNGSGVVTTIPANGDTVIHRLYYVHGSFVWAFGQRLYTSVADALTRILVDRSKYVPSTRLDDSALIAEIISTKSNTDLSGAGAAIITYGGSYFSIGNSGGIGEAPVDGNTYGRRNATWSTAVAAADPMMTGEITLTDAAPRLVEVLNPVGAGYAGLNIKQLAFDWCNVEASPPSDQTFFRSYNPANGNLRNTTTWDLATGRWTFPEAAFVAAGGSATDTTAGRVLKVGDFGVGANLATTMLLDSGSLDTVRTSGNYRTTTGITGQPSGGTEGVLEVFQGSAGLILQRWTRTTDSSTFIRVETSSVWSAWRTVALDVGTAAFGTLTTSTTDGTTNRVTRVGDFGLGGVLNAPILVNLDTTATLQSGFFRFSSGTTLGTKPTGSAANGTVLVERFNNTTIVKETWTDVVGGGAIAPRTWIRTSSAVDTWGAWTELASLDAARTVPLSTTTGTLVLADKGKCVDVTAASITVPSGVFSGGDVVSIYCNSLSSITIIAGAGLTMATAGGGAGNRTLATRGIATLWFTSGSFVICNGAGVS